MKIKKFIAMLATVMLLLCIWNQKREFAPTMNSAVNSPEKQRCVFLDAGHGGFDPGKIGINGAKEKDVNLDITLRVGRYLEAQDIRVVYSRLTDESLCGESTKGKKVQDMKGRIELIKEAAPDLAVSIHQNSYPDESIRGAQVFYYEGSGKGQEIAMLLQRSLVERVDPDNHRQSKGNKSYYLLKKTSSPIVIAECGFLSNREEAEQLCDNDYQDKIAWALAVGILQYLNSED